MRKSQHWYAVYTKSRHEKKLHTSLIDKGIECYLPIVKELRQRSDRKKWVSEPLIRSYIFVRINEFEYYNVLNTPGAVCFVTFEGKASQIPEIQINTLKNFLRKDNQRPIIITQGDLVTGDTMEVTSGPLEGMTGEVIQLRGQYRIVLRFNAIGYCVHTNISLNEVRRIRKKREPGMCLVGCTRLSCLFITLIVNFSWLSF